MALPGLVLMHGGAHAADCWEPTIAQLSRQATELRVLAVDLPGRAAKPADLAGIRIADFVNSVVSDVDDAELNDIVVVGHSMAGLTAPGVVAKLGAARVREMMLIAAFVPPQGLSVVSTLVGPLAPLARSVRWMHMSSIPRPLARFAFCNGMTRAQREFTLARLYGESINVIVEPVDRSDLPTAVPRTWIMTLRERALSLRQQRFAIASLGGVDTMICVDSCHDVMISEPNWLATTLAERCRLHARE
jgi:pimeloyl-ACP methyl ester carboxylesterase